MLLVSAALRRSPITIPAERAVSAAMVAARSADRACSTTWWPSSRSDCAAARPSPSVLPVMKTIAIRCSSRHSLPRQYLHANGLMRGALEEPVPPLARSSHRFRAEQYRNSVPKFEKPHHILCGGLVFLEMSRLEVRLVRVDVRIHLEDEDVSRILLVAHRIQRQHSRLQPDGRFDLLLHRCLVGLELCRIDLDFGHAHIWFLRILAHGRTTRECRQRRGAKNQNLLCIHVTLLHRSRKIIL